MVEKLFIGLAYAVDPNGCAGGTFKPGLPIAGGAECVTFNQYFTSLVNLAIGVAIAVSIGIVVYAGIIYAQNRGEASKIALAKELVGGVVTGMAIILLIKLILPTLGIN